MPKSRFQEVREDHERLRRNLSLMQGTLTNAEMGKIIGVSNVTFGARKKNPGSLTR
jgi:DNA-binding XRE family transcriptional regulator